MRAATVLLLVLTLAPVGATSQNPSTLGGIHRIYVDSMGGNDAAARFRALLGEELSKAGFLVGSTPSAADARLSGVLSTKKALHGHIRAYATVELMTPAGSQIWGGEFHEPRFRWTWSNDAVAVRARDIAKKLKADQQALAGIGG
jgi:hypothetical protein